MNTTVEYIQKYLKEKYNIDFQIEYMGTQRELYYKKNKKEYRLSCGYAQSNINDPYNECWSIYEDFMDYNELCGSGSAREDKGNETIDEIMHEWGFKKERQTDIFDFIKEGE